MKFNFYSKFEKFSVFDNKYNFDKIAYETNLKIVTEFLMKLSFPTLDSDTLFLNTFEGQASLIDEEFQDHFINFIATTPRIPSEIGLSTTRLIEELNRIFKFHLKNVKSKRIRVQSPQFYADSPVVHKLVAYDYQSRILYILMIAACVAGVYYLYHYLRYGTKQKRD